MNKQLENNINWDEVYALEHAMHDNPHHILGPKSTAEGIQINGYLPNADKMKVIEKENGQSYEMVPLKTPGFFSVLTDHKRKFQYQLEVTFDNGDTMTYDDPYQFEPVIDSMDIKKFQEGIHYQIYEKLGAHPCELDGISGVLFAVWAPNALRVSVVGDFNLWDGRRHPMRRLQYSGIYELFIPGISVGEIYKFEIRNPNGDVSLKADPYANGSQLRPDNASKVVDIKGYQWGDENWLSARKKDTAYEPVSIYEVHLGSWKRPDDGREFLNYKEMAHQLADYLKEMEYTHVEIMPIMEHPYDPSWGYQVTGYYAPTARYGEPQDFMYFVDYMHKEGIGVILDWVPAHFPKDAFGLARFDGTALYEHLDSRQGEHPDWGTYIFNYGRSEVKNFLIANALYWLKEYHIDGIRIDAVASMLYLDYGREDGQWVANMYGGNENLEALEFLKHLNSVVGKNFKGVMMIAEESTTWPYLTHDLKKEGVGFQYKWNMGWMNDFLEYMKADPIYRKHKHGQLTFSLVYAYSEKFILVLSHDEVVHGKGSMIGKMPGDYEQKFANLRAAYGFMTTHPGKKLLFMGQEIAQFTEFDEKKSVEWELLEYETHSKMQRYVKALNHLYRTEPALYELDIFEEGFEWINNISADESIVVFLRKTKKKTDTLLVVCNFTPVPHEDYKIGVPYLGKYKEIFNSDQEEFGGSGMVNARLKQSEKDECDARDHSIRIKVPPLGMSVFKFKQ